MSLSDVAQITITSTTQGLTRAGFGTEMVGSPNANWVERVRSYANLNEAVVDWATTTPEYQALAKIFAQEPKPPLAKVGRRALKPTQRWNFVPVVLPSQKYQLKVGTGIAEYTSDASPLLSEITAGLTAAVNALPDAVTASDLGPGTSLRIVADVAGAHHEIELLDPNLGVLVQDHADPGIATDLAAIFLEDDDWYTYHELFPSKATIVAAGAWIEANEKTMVYDTQDTDVATVAIGSATDVFKSMKDLAYVRSMGIYHPNSKMFLAEAWAGKCLPFDPGTETWSLKPLASVTAPKSTATHRTNIRAKNGNFYRTISGISVTFDGKVASGSFFDFVRFRDWFKIRLQERIFAAAASLPKIPFDSRGEVILEGLVRAQIGDGIAVGAIATTPRPTVAVKPASEVSSADKAIRHWPDIEFSFTYSSAVHTVAVNGVITL